MKRLLILLMTCFCWVTLHAAYLRNIPMTLTQPDGTILQCFASGDEYFNYLHDENGYTIMRHPQTGFYVYAEKRDGKLVATNLVAAISLVCKVNRMSKVISHVAAISLVAAINPVVSKVISRAAVTSLVAAINPVVVISRAVVINRVGAIIPMVDIVSLIREVNRTVLLPIRNSVSILPTTIRMPSTA